MAEINVSAGKVPVWYYATGAGAVYVAYTFYKRLSGPKTVAAAPVASTTTPVVAAGSYGTDYTGAIANLQTSVDQLNKNATTPGATAPKFSGAITATAANQILAGAGYQPDTKQAQKQFTPISSNSKIYLLVSDLLQAVTVGGNSLYYEPNPGQFSLIPGASVNNLAAGTPIYRQVG